MGRSKDDSSWASQMANGPEHFKVIAEMDLATAQRTLEKFQQMFPKVYEYWLSKRTDGEGAKHVELQPR